MRAHGIGVALSVSVLMVALTIFGPADGRSARHRARGGAAAKYRPRALPYNPRVPPTYTEYTPPGTVTTSAPAAPPPKLFCGGEFFAPRAPFARRVWRWALEGPRVWSLEKRTPPCDAVGSLLHGLVSWRPGELGQVGGRFLFGEWTCDAATHVVTCANARAPVFVLRILSVVVRVGPVNAGSLIGAMAPGKSIFARSDYYVVKLSGVAAPLVPGPSVALSYFVVIGRHDCGLSAGATEQLMAGSGGLILAVASRTAAAFTAPLYLRLRSSPTYRACVFLQRSATDRRAAALIAAAF